MVFAADGALFERALASVAGRTTDRHVHVDADRLKTTSLDELQATWPRAPSMMRTRASARTRLRRFCTRRDRPAAEGRHQHAADAVFEPGDAAHRASAPRRTAADPVRLAAVESHVRRQSQLRHRPLQRRHAVHRRGEADGGGDSTRRIANLAEIATTAYFNVPRGYDFLVPRLTNDPAFARHFFSRLEMLFCAAAALRQKIADGLSGWRTRRATAQRIPFVTGLGATESAPMALCAGDAAFTGGRVGVPVPGVELKVAPVGDQMEGATARSEHHARLLGESRVDARGVRRRGLLQARGRARLLRSAGSVEGIRVPGAHLGGLQALDGDVRAGRGGSARAALALRRSGLRHRGRGTRSRRSSALSCSRTSRRAASRGHPGRVFPRQLSRRTRVSWDGSRSGFVSFAALHPASSTAVVRAILLEDPPAIDAQETTEKGSVNQKAVLSRRAALVAQLYGDAGPGILIDITNRTVSQ